MARNLRKRTQQLDVHEARGLIISLITYLEALDRLYAKSTTLPASTKITASITLDELDYLLGVYTEKEFRYPSVD